MPRVSPMPTRFRTGGIFPCGRPWVHIRRAPRSTIEVPSVATNAGTLRLVTMSPFARPTTAPMARVSSVTGRNSALFPAMKVAANTFAVEMTSATERSRPPPMITKVWPMAAMLSIEKPFAMFSRFVALKKLTPVARKTARAATRRAPRAITRPRWLRIFPAVSATEHAAPILGPGVSSVYGGKRPALGIYFPAVP